MGALSFDDIRFATFFRFSMKGSHHYPPPPPFLPPIFNDVFFFLCFFFGVEVPTGAWGVSFDSAVSWFLATVLLSLISIRFKLPANQVP